MPEQTLNTPPNDEPQPDDEIVPEHMIRREPILDQNQGLVAYRMRVLWATEADLAPDPAPALIESARSHGVNAFFAFIPHWIDASPKLLQNAFAYTLPRNRTMLEFAPGLEITPELIQSLQKLAHGGAKFSLRGDLANAGPYDSLLPFCKAIGFDPQISSKADIFRQSFKHKQAGCQLMALNTPNKAALENFQMLGFTLFQGNWPSDIQGTSALSPRQKTLLQLVTLIMGEGEIPEIQACLQKDPELVQTLLDMVNTPAFGLSQEVESLNQAIMLLGRRQLQRWIQVLMYTDVSKPKGYLSPTLIQASARAHLMAAVSTLLHPEQTIRAEACFTTGILSVMDQLFGGTMQDLLANINVDVPVRDALLQRSGLLGPDLRLAILAFPSNKDPAEGLPELLKAIGIGCTKLDALIQEAFTWAHSITQASQ